jgi:ATP phosphoribosyltransferase regulatory subunit
LIENAGGSEQVLPKIKSAMDKPEELEAIAQLEEVIKIIDGCGLNDNVRIDFSVVNGMGYYNGLVMRGYIAGIPEAVLSGGQYDKLPRRLGKNCRAIGFAVYLDLLERLSAQQSEYDVDILLICNEEVDGVTFQKAVEALMQNGSVLVCTQIPKNSRPRMIYAYKNGEVLPYEGNA